MVVDDDMASATMMMNHLRTCGFRIVNVKTAPMVLTKALSEAPSLIIVDLMVPRRTGLKLCKDLKSDHATNHIPIIMVTASLDESDKIVALELGVDDFMLKPLNLHELNLRIERSLERSRFEPNLLPSGN